MRRARFNLACIIVACGVLAACGGGGSSSGASPPASSTTVTPSPAPPAPGTPPKITGTPTGSVKVGQAYVFRPSASDADGDLLSFTITGQPGWLAFDPVTGALSGNPTAAQAGTYSNIVITVSDGRYSSALPAFSIAVVEQTLGSANLSWVPPTTNEDGTPVTDLAGYRVVYGQSAAELSQSLTIGSAAITSAVIEGLTQGTWYFAVKAYTAANVESDLSTVASKTIY